MKTLDGKVAVVTGAASGIGRALARRLAQEKTKVVLVDVEAPALEAAEKSLREGGATVLALRADVSKSAELAAVAEKAREAFGTVHVICNNAGVGGGGGPMWLLSEADWEWTLSVNLWGVIHGIRLFVPQLLASGEEGHIVNTASMAGLTSNPFIGPYTATKHAVVAISEVLAKELEMIGAKVGVSVLCPGFVKTNISTSQRNRPAELRPAEAPSGPAPALATAMQMLVDGGQPPEAVADRVIEAILEPRFYVLTHPEMKPSIARRMKEVLEEQQPTVDQKLRELLGG